MMDISVIVPLYKGRKYINRIIEMFEKNIAFLNKNNLELETELIFINDYPDEVLMVNKNTKNINLYNNDKNKGIHASRIGGINNSKGKYLLLLDQDDEITDDFLYIAYTSIGDNDVHILNGYKEKNTKNKEIIYEINTVIKRLLHKKSFFVSCCHIISPGHCLIKRESIPKEWYENIMKTNCSDDLFLWILMISKGCSFEFSNNVCYTHKFTGINVSSDKENRYKSDNEMFSYLKKIEYVRHKDLQLLEIRKRINGRKPSLLDKYSYIYGYYVCLYICLNKIFGKRN